MSTSVTYQAQGTNTQAGDAPLNWPKERRLQVACQTAAAPGKQLPLAYLADFYSVEENEIHDAVKAGTFAPFKSEVINTPSGPDYADNPQEKEEEEGTLGEFDEDGDWTNGEENDAPEGFDEIIGD